MTKACYPELDFIPHLIIFERCGVVPAMGELEPDVDGPLL